MSATSRLKPLLFIIAGLAMVVVGLTGLTTAAQAEDSGGGAPCEETQDQVVKAWFETDPGAPWVATGLNRVKTEGTDPTYTDWVNQGELIRTEEDVPPGANTDTVRYNAAGTVDDSTEGHWDNTVITFYTWTGGNSADAPPVYADETETALNSGWNATSGSPQGGPHAAAPLYSPYEAGNGPNTASWFLKAGTFVPGVEDTDYLWQKQVRTLESGTDDVIEYEYSKTIEGNDCPEEGPAVCHPVEGNGELGNGWNLISPAQASSHIDESLFPDGVYWQHETADGRHDIYSEDGETCPDPEEPPVCPKDTDHEGEEYPGEGVESCDDPEEPPVCPKDTDHDGEEYPAEGVESCDDDDDEKCPKDTDHEGEEYPGEGVESCDDDDPIIDPGEGENPGNNPGNNPSGNPGSNSNNPGNSPSSNPQGSNQPNNGVTPVSAPGAAVPSAVNAGLAPTQQELIGTGNGLSLVGMGTVLIGLGLLGLTLRPRRGRRLAG
jgi:hypothetical protein